MAHGVGAEMTPEHQKIFRDLCTKVDDRSSFDAAIERIEELERALAEAISAIHRLSEGQPFDAVVIADTVKRRTIQLETKLDQEQRKAGQEMIERLILIETVQKLEAENKWLREALSREEK